ncbi:amino acid ABC transporter permease [Ancylobacter terrae]|uniref:amino acid ABC transporter permease n=1 Tax=Ancylobacter sp. sgz301288 TaxID=3342077 RepID=UPI00385DB324
MWGVIDELPRFFSFYNLLFLAQAIGMTLTLSILGCLLGYLAGFGIALVRTRQLIDIAPLRWAAVTFVETVRRLPFLVLLFLVMFGFQAAGFILSSFMIALLAVFLRTAAVGSETIRGGLDSVHPTQWDAAVTMNLPRLVQLRSIILPQAWRVILPPSLVQFVQLMKSTSIASQFSVVELTYAGKILNQKGFSAILSYGTVLVLYYILCLIAEKLIQRLEKRLVLS